MQRLLSKRNPVFLQQGRVEKHCRAPEDARREYEKLRLLREKGVRVPEAQLPQGNILFMEYLPGITLPDFLETPHSVQELQTAAQAIADWLADFYRAVDHERTGEIRGDVNGRNFLLHQGQVWGMDFETPEYGWKEQDFGALLAYVESYTLELCAQQEAFREWLAVCLIRRLDADAQRIEQHRQQEWERMRLRRSN